MVIFLVSDPQTQRTISLHFPPFFLHEKKKRNKRTRENLTYLLCMTQISIIAICVQVLCLVVDDVR